MVTFFLAVLGDRTMVLTAKGSTVRRSGRITPLVKHFLWVVVRPQFLSNLSEHCENVLRKFPLESKKYIAREAYFTIHVHQEHTEDSSFCGFSCAYTTVIRS